MMGPECVAQQKKFVSSRIMNCGERSACESDISACTGLPDGADGALASAGARRTNSETGIMITATTSATICIEVRQSWYETSQAASGDMVIGAMPIPADTSETARRRCGSNQPGPFTLMG